MCVLHVLDTEFTLERPVSQENTGNLIKLETLEKGKLYTSVFQSL